MSDWEIIRNEANIILVGNFNPKIFHPEWFIGKGIVEEWDYKKDEVINVPDMSQMTLPGNRTVSVCQWSFENIPKMVVRSRPL